MQNNTRAFMTDEEFETMHGDEAEVALCALPFADRCIAGSELVARLTAADMPENGP